MHMGFHHGYQRVPAKSSRGSKLSICELVSKVKVGLVFPFSLAKGARNFHKNED